MNPEEAIIKILEEKANFVCTLPCDKMKGLFGLVYKRLRYVPLTREEEGVGICAGAYLAGARPAMLIQSSGVGNTINALCSLTKFYEMPLPLLISWRGVYKEPIEAQKCMGKYLPRLFDALDIPYTTIEGKEDIPLIGDVLDNAYDNSVIHGILLSPKTWEGSMVRYTGSVRRKIPKAKCKSMNVKPKFRRYEIIQHIAPYLRGKVVVSNLGVPSKEVYNILDQDSNFYMLGSMGMASPIGLGISLNTEKEVFVIEGDGSLLMNPGTLSTVSAMKPRNLTIIAIDNGVYGSTGNQPTGTSECVDLACLASSMGIKKIFKAGDEKELKEVFNNLGDGPNFIHVVALPGNATVPNIPLSPLEIKKRVMRVLG